MGLHRAWPDAEIVGVDIKPQPRYPFTFVQADALEYPLDGFDFIWASPPCQDFSAYQRNGRVKPVGNLIPQTRARLVASGVPYAIENVPGAPLLNPTMLCGSSFGLDVRRHRIFETSFPILLTPSCNHYLGEPRFKPSSDRTNLRRTIEIGAWDEPVELQRAAIGIDWMTVPELSQAIPPAFSEWIARQLAVVPERAAGSVSINEVE